MKQSADVPIRPQRTVLFLRSLVLLFGTFAMRSTAQTPGTVAPLPHEFPSASSRNGHDEDREAGRAMRDRLERLREEDRQKHIVEETQKLLALTQQFRRSTEDHDSLTEADRALLLQIEKLSRDIRNRMRGM